MSVSHPHTVSPDLLPLILEFLPVGVWILAPDGQILMANSAGQRIWGGAQYVGMSDWGVYKAWWGDSGRLVQPEEWAAARVLRNRTPITGDLVEIEAFDGTRRTILNSAVPLLGPTGELLGVVAVNQDITDRRRDERERERLVKELQVALNQIYTLSGLLPICANCKKIRDEHQEWHRLEEYIERHTDAHFTHSLCPHCSKALYPEDG